MERLNNTDKLFFTADLLCEYASNPLGIDTKTPLLSWALRHKERGQTQTAYRIVVSSSQTLLEENNGDLWDSGKVISDQSSGITYGGADLSSGQTCWWKVKAWDGNGREGDYSKAATFETGLFYPEDWHGTWYGHAGGFNGSSVLMRKEFELQEGKRVAKARAYISGLGYYELRLNGRKVGDHVLDPGATDYSRRILYSTYDVADRLKPGRNVIGIMLGNGWYGAPKALLQMNIDFEDGSREVVCTAWDWGAGWHVSRGPIVRNSIFEGEVYDARLEKEGWDTEAYDMAKYNHRASGWITASSMESPGGKLVSQVMEPIKVMGEINPVKVTRISDKVQVYDIGQNMAGWAKIVVSGSSGSIVSMKYAESLYEDGTVNQENLRLADAKDTYILRGGEREIYAPRFTYHGFRYVQVEIEAGDARVSQLTAQIVRSSVEAIGSFACSDELVNRIHRNVWWTEASNLHSIPTDCPQRDERMAWLNDATARAEEALYNFDMSRFYQKWLDDIEDTRDETTGAIADTAPYRWGFRPADPVASCYLTIPLLLYRHYGNKRVLQRHYEGLKGWTEYLANEAEQFIVKRSYYGDWASPIIDCEIQSDGEGAISKGTPGELVSTAHFYWNAALLVQIAAILDKPEDERVYAGLAANIKEAFNRSFFDGNTNNYAKGSQGSNAIALKFGLVPEERIKDVVRNLVEDIEQAHDFHLSTGNQCTKHMLEALAEQGQIETAYRIVTQTTYPSWGFMIANGATTIWERWEYDIGNAMNSRNHPMHANVGSWFYKIVAGILPAESARGFDRMIIKPYPAGDLSFVNASLKTIKGLVEVRWVRGNDEFSLEVNIPANSRAKVCLPVPAQQARAFIIKEGSNIIWTGGGFMQGMDGIYGGIGSEGYAELEVGSGVYSFTVEHI
ncbi:alpha-L-rhamnosidase [Cohnella silvisoli]|uniref:alpha-L-rhamnosidase n=1 Tax=Cohnella silvisoli TaxID=2873699 RepID=A0ABV1KLM3_9BACL|nr:alpha-L-rhamnosidase [Cohnella silvisoli]MCD9020654.1 glycoside hydrolase family 78 protein [Cohnella silvisoli]